MMKITLKNGATARLDWNYLVLQYIEEELGGITKLDKGFMKDNEVKVMNTFVYALLQANMDEEMTFKQAVRLVKVEDVPKIFELVEKEINKANKAAESKKLYSPESEEKEIDWARIKFTGKTIGLTFEETMKLHPLELERMVEMYINLEKLKGGK